MTAKKACWQSGRDGNFNPSVTNVAEPHGDVPQSTILTGQMPGKEERMDDYGRGLTAGNEASCESAEHHGDERQPPDIVKRAFEAFKRENPEMDATAFEDSRVAISHEGVVHVNVDVLEKCFDLDRDTIDSLTALQFWSHPVLDALDAFPPRVQLEEEDYWIYDDVKAWVINYRHVFAVRVVQANVPKALAVFDEWVKEKQCPAWCWETIFVEPIPVVHEDE